MAAIGVIGTLLGLGLGVYELYERFFASKTFIIDVLNSPIHLGDNYRASIGGDRSLRPNPSPCEEAYPANVMLICLDKSAGYFPIGDTTSDALFHMKQTLIPSVERVNIEAYRHVYAGSFESLSEEELSRSFVFDGGPKVWRENAGNYYSRVAPVLVSFQTSIFEKAGEAGIDLTEADSVEISFDVEGLTGGRRSDQVDQLYVFLNNNIKRVDFPSDKTREVRRLSFDYVLSSDLISSGKPLNFGFLVVPWQEQFPRPPKGKVLDPRGPGHFQDFDINRIFATMTVD